MLRRMCLLFVLAAHTCNVFGKDVATHVVEAAIAEEKGEMDAAIKHYQQAYVQSPELLSINIGLARCYYIKGLNNSSKTMLKKVLGIDKNNVDAMFMLSRIAMRENDLQNAVSYLEQIIKIKPGSVEAYSSLAQAYQGLGLTEEAHSTSEKVRNIGQ